MKRQSRRARRMYSKLTTISDWRGALSASPTYQSLFFVKRAGVLAIFIA